MAEWTGIAFPSARWRVTATWDHVEQPDVYFQTLSEVMEFIKTFPAQMNEDTVLEVKIEVMWDE